MKAKPTIQAILFDKDGTLLDYEMTWGPINRVAASLAARGQRRLEERLLLIGGVHPVTGLTLPDSLLAAGNTREIAEAWIAAGSPYDIAELTSALDDLFVRSASQAVPVTDLGVLFRRLTERGLVLGIASSDSESAIRATLDTFGLGSFVRCVIGYDSGFGSKPGPGMLLGFSAETGIPPEKVLVIGDNVHDMEMARAGGAGWKIGVLSGTGALPALSLAADMCLPSVAFLETDFLDHDGILVRDSIVPRAIM